MEKIIFTLLLMSSMFSMGQSEEKLPYYEIPDYQEDYTANTVAARMIDGLGFRYYWVTEGLRDEDLNFKPSETGRATMETIEHIYGLSKFIRNSILSDNKDAYKAELSFDDMRKQTLLNFKLVSDVLRNANFQLQDTEVPFWNIINGPIADALWHCGQVVMLRRSSGNPFNSKVNLFSGKLRE
ncbi:hypothetical protein ACFSKN_05680 [Mariniflexile gromovii]|uniref:DinB family protein n=1 Tax=Mariniflexile gromovii TaxID=362523 RepID=A0ABS4BTL6_9FLAO|nr:hypothetical protein [Mariniflexile gromovii]MBP0903935.1 hypothetical protein [Mariniflexile gromovii]